MTRYQGLQAKLNELQKDIKAIDNKLLPNNQGEYHD